MLRDPFYAAPIHVRARVWMAEPSRSASFWSRYAATHSLVGTRNGGRSALSVCTTTSATSCGFCPAASQPWLTTQSKYAANVGAYGPEAAWIVVRLMSGN